MISIYSLNQIVYKILGAERSTKLAYSPLGRLIIGDPEGEKIFIARDGIKLKLKKKEAIKLGIYHLGAVHLLETLAIKKILVEGDVVVDIGAYIDGWYGLLAAKIIGKKGHVYSFEPHPIFFKRLRENIKLNGFTNITAERLAVSDKKSSALFYEAGSSSSLYTDQLSKNEIQSQKPIFIETVTLDSYIKKKKIKKVNFLKIDAEGADMKVLRGAKNLLSTSQEPDLMVEVLDMNLNAAGSRRNEILSYLDCFGYKPYIFTHEGLKPYSKSEDQITPNLFFTKRALLLR